MNPRIHFPTVINIEINIINNTIDTLIALPVLCRMADYCECMNVYLRSLFFSDECSTSSLSKLISSFYKLMSLLNK